MKFKKLVYYFLIALMISSVVMLMLIFVKPPTIRKEQRLTSIPTDTIEVRENKNFSQYFQSQTDSINIVKIYIDNVSNPNGYLKLSFYGENGEELSTNEVELKQFVTPGINFIALDSVNNVKDKIIQLKIEVVKSESQVLIGVDDEYYENQYIIQNDTKINKSIIMYYEGNAKNPGLIVHFLLIFSISLILYIFLKEEIIQERNDKNAKNKRK